MPLLIKIEVDNTFDMGLLVAMGRNPNRGERKSLYGIGNRSNERPDRF